MASAFNLYLTEPTDECVTPLDPKPLTRLQPIIQERVEHLNPVQFVEDLDLLLFGQVGQCNLIALVHQPHLLLLIDDVHILETNLPAVDDAQGGLKLPQRPLVLLVDKGLEALADVDFSGEAEGDVQVGSQGRILGVQLAHLVPVDLAEFAVVLEGCVRENGYRVGRCRLARGLGARSIGSA